MTSLVVVHDAIHANISHLPPGPSAGYTTGSPDIKWTPSDWTNHPTAIRICQDFGASDTTADVLDVESGAATNIEAATWYHAAAVNWAHAKRPGQRHPAIYTSAANVTSLVNTLIANGVHQGPFLWVANWNLSDPQASADVAAAAGPFPIIGVQFSSGAFYDTSVFATAWRNAVSVLPTPPAPAAAPGGPFRHVLNTGQRLADVAATRNTTALHLRDETRKNLTEADIDQGRIYYTTN